MFLKHACLAGLCVLGLLLIQAAANEDGIQNESKPTRRKSPLAALFSDALKVKEESAKTEPRWKGAGQSPGLQIWRIEKFKVKEWPKEKYGKFYNGDSYIVLNTHKENETEALRYDIHVWRGKDSTLDERSTAAFKMNELDVFLSGDADQHFEDQGKESGLFKTYFEEIQILEGGADTGFRKVNKEKHQPRLLRVSGSKKDVEVTEVPMNRNSLLSDDVFILDHGQEIFLWTGKDSNKDEKYKGLQHVQTLNAERSGKPKVWNLDEKDLHDNHRFYEFLEEEDDDADQGRTRKIEGHWRSK